MKWVYCYRYHTSVILVCLFCRSDAGVCAQVPVSTVLPEERLLVRKIDEAPGIYHIIARYGEL